MEHEPASDRFSIKLIVGIFGGVLTTLIAAYFIRASSAIEEMRTDMAVVKVSVASIADKDIPARVTALEGQVSSVLQRMSLMETSRWTKQDHMAYDRFLEERFKKLEGSILKNEGGIEKNETGLHAILEKFQGGTPGDVLKVVTPLREELAKIRDQLERLKKE